MESPSLSASLAVNSVVELGFEATSYTEAMRAVVNRMLRDRVASHDVRADLVARFLANEKRSSVTLSSGVAIPHLAVMPEENIPTAVRWFLSGPVILFGSQKTPIDLIFCVIAPSANLREIVARGVKIIQSTGFLAGMRRDSWSAKEFRDVIVAGLERTEGLTPSPDFDRERGCYETDMVLYTGIHARPAAVLCSLASSMDCEAQISLGDTMVDATSIIGVMMMEQGDAPFRYRLRAKGPEAREFVLRATQVFQESVDGKYYIANFPQDRSYRYLKKRPND